MDEGRVQDCAIYTDAMDHSLAAELKQAFAGCRFSTEALCGAVEGSGLADVMRKDIISLLKKQEL